MNRIKRAPYGLVILAALVLFASASESAVKDVSIEELTAQSATIIRGTVQSMQSHWNDDRNFIFTEINVTVTHTYHGDLDENATITTLIPGGEIDGVGLGVEHAPVFIANEDVILFLNPVPDEAGYTVTGWELGKFTVDQGAIKETGETVDGLEKTIQDALNGREE